MGCFSSGGSSGKSTSESKTATQRAAINAALGQVPSGFEGYASLIGQGANIYGGTRVAPLTETQLGILGQLPSFSTAFGDLLGSSTLQPQLEATAGQLLSGEMGAQPITPEQEAAFFSGSIRNPALKEFTETTLPGVREAFAGPGYWGSARANEVAEAYQDVGDWLGEQRANLAWDVLGRNQEIEQQKAQTALGAIAPSIAASQAPLQQALGALGGLSQTAGLSSLEQTQQQAEINAEMQKFFEENQITDPQVMEIFSMLIGTPVNTSWSSSSSSGAGLGYGALGALTGSYFNSLFPTT